MRNVFRRSAWLAVGVLLAAMPVLAASPSRQGNGTAVVTLLPNKNTPAPNVPQQDLSARVNGKSANITGWKPLQDSPTELVVLIDSAARTSLGTQISDIQHFVRSLPPNVKATIAYMQNGRAALTGPLTSDRAQTLKGLHIPTGGVPGVSASPYFCLSDLASQWPSEDRAARREVVMITDGVDYYDLRYDPEDPYLQTAINKSVQAHLIVYSIYWRNIGRLDRSGYETDAGQNLLAQLTAATGGNSYWQGFGNPVSLRPYFQDIEKRLANQYEVSFMAPSADNSRVVGFKLKVNQPGVKFDAPEQVVVFGSEAASMD